MSYTIVRILENIFIMHVFSFSCHFSKWFISYNYFVILPFVCSVPVDQTNYQRLIKLLRLPLSPVFFSPNITRNIIISI